MKIRILFVITQLYKGGAELSLLNLLKMLNPENYNVDLLIHDMVYLTRYTSLIPEVPCWVNVKNAAEGESRIVSYIKKVVKKAIYAATGILISRKAALTFVKGKEYSFAFNWGEWMAPCFIEKKVSAAVKYSVIHGDLDKAIYLNKNRFFKSGRAYNSYVFVSVQSMRGAIYAFPNIANKAALLHNIADEYTVKKLAVESVNLEKYECPLIVSVANFRREKNHLRAIEAMRILKERGVTLVWLNIGGSADPVLMSRLKAKIREYGLGSYFIIMGYEDNPYKYMSHATAVAVLSDFESWSMVITEAKILGIPVVSTKTSGGMAQLSHAETGILTDFDEEAIANAIELILTDKNLQGRIKANLYDFSPATLVSSEWDALIKKRCTLIKEGYIQ